MKQGLFLLLSFILIFPVNPIAEAKTVMKLSSPSFQNHGMIPKQFTCQDENVNPELTIEGIPDDARSLVLIMDDPDAPMGTWIHWVVYDIPIINKIPEHSILGQQGMNSSRKKDYGGPCPPSGTHRYFFKIYALDQKLDLPEGKDVQAVNKTMDGHILDKTELVGLYKKQ